MDDTAARSKQTTELSYGADLTSIVSAKLEDLQQQPCTRPADFNILNGLLC